MALTQSAAAAKDARNGLSEMQHRHFATVAAIIKSMRHEDESNFQVDRTAHHFANELAKTNTRFNRTRFLDACGVKK